MKSLLVERLADVLDPETGSSVIALGIVRRVDVRDGKVIVEIDRSHPLAQHFCEEAEAAVRDAAPDAVPEVRLVA